MQNILIIYYLPFLKNSQKFSKIDFENENLAIFAENSQKFSCPTPTPALTTTIRSSKRILVKRKFIYCNIYTNELYANHQQQTPAGTIVLQKCLSYGIKLNAEFQRKEGCFSFVSALLANIYIFEGLILINLKNCE